ncbi:glycosyltransferase [Myroides indicus]|uniref:Hyaluronan synthase n=1 Tax=Myroides indicus TaxID=1323422 RepID=A0A4R7F5W8_9FLAO|nr:glycosyltransferase [Myroides indicus]TDS65092.1 hyaluronan synthase [Myroides indicus]
MKLHQSEYREKTNKIRLLKNKFVRNITDAALTTTDYAILFSTLLLLFGGIFLVYQLQPYFEKIHLDRMKTFSGQMLAFITISLLIVQVAFLIYILYLYTKYKPIKSVSDYLLPTCTIIVPAYNEGELVWQTLFSLTESNYPAEKLQIIAIDDGSKDDTWQWMKRAKDRLGNRLQIFQQPENMGKRHALYRGFNLGIGEIFITVDSDSVVKKDTLRNLVSPFIVNKKCGAVGGNVQVLNNKKAIIPRMLNVSFVFSFEFIRSAQSVIGTVLCTPGALAAYRREAVLNCLPEWISQTFMGQPTDIGEDRAMTNMILKQGFHVLFQQNAHVLTNTPEKYKNLYKMFIRWERSNVRENIMMSKFAFSNFREGPKAGARILLINQWIKVIMAYPATFLMLYFIFTHPILFISSALVSTFIFSSIQVLFYSKKYNFLESFWAYPYSIFYIFTLFWITPYAIATANKRGWLTRGLPQK